MASGDELVIEFDCTQATEAIPQWAAEEGHAITDYQQIGDAAWEHHRSKSLTQHCPPPYQRRRLQTRRSLPRTAKALLTAPLFFVIGILLCQHLQFICITL
ncbi:SirA family protein [Escherichia coli]|uniref:SirA family protein n=1 Tax=Escherichia coli TaxID=562 RepID=A0A376U7H0_ECOLX|nr:SirA family protein [Escherichia coli]